MARAATESATHPPIRPAGLQPASGWITRVERGPDWLFVRLESAAGDAAGMPGGGLAAGIWRLLEEHRARRLVLELDDVRAIDDRLVDVIGELDGRLGRDGGLLRVCGLSAENLARLRSAGPTREVAHFASRSEALGTRRSGPACGGCGGEHP